MAAANGHVDCLKILLQNNASLNQATTTDGVTPLHAAAGNGELSAAQLLVVHGASIDAVTAFNDTPFSDAAEEGHQHLAEWLNAVATCLRCELLLHYGCTPASRVCFSKGGSTRTTASCFLRRKSWQPLQHQRQRQPSCLGKTHCQHAKRQSSSCAVHRLDGSTARTSFTTPT